MLSLKLMDRLAHEPSLKNWTGLGLAVQAYQKRTLSVIEKLTRLAEQTGHRFMVRLVKGAYWDSEIKHAQVEGFPNFPVFTTKPGTDFHYLACAKLMLEASPTIYPQFATHNAHTLAAVDILAEAAGVTLAAHPDDPPMPTIRGTPRLVYQPSHYQRLIDLNPSPANQLEFCVGSLAEMIPQGGSDIYDTVATYAAQHRLGFVHLRNVVGKVPTYKESFIDDGDVDVLRVMRILHEHKFEGVIIPDHAPQMSCAAPWHAGMAFALGFMAAGKNMLLGLDATVDSR